MPNTITVLSHLRWNSVFQRPHHITTRLAQKYNIIFVEEPIDDAVHKYGTAESFKPHKNITVFTPFIKWDNWETMSREYIELLNNYFRTEVADSLFWFYSPFYIYFLRYFQPRGIVYDCMDELSAFKNASPNLPRYEKELLSQADIVFTGGKSLYESKKRLNPNTFCFPSSVDAAHFARALDVQTPLPADIQAIQRPIVGFYGVIDERIDLDLLKQVATQLPHISFVMIGPVVKIDETTLPKNKNIYYLGKKEYSQLPEYLKAFDITMMPFALNESTKYISPTKTLEYMAALKPVISTPIEDVVRDYKEIVSIVKNEQEFVSAIDGYLTESTEQKQKRQKKEKEIVQKTSWDSTVSQILYRAQTLLNYETEI